MAQSKRRLRGETCRQEASRCRDAVDREVWIRLAKHWEDIDQDVDVLPARQTRGLHSPK